MGQSLVKNLVHLVYSTKYRKPWIPGEVGQRLFAYQAGIFKQWQSAIAGCHFRTNCGRCFGGTGSNSMNDTCGTKDQRGIDFPIWR